MKNLYCCYKTSSYLVDIDSNLIKFLKKQQSSLDGIINNIEPIKNIIQKLLDARDNNKKIYIMGNGGSGSTASHFCSDLIKTAIIENKNRFQVSSLTDNMPIISSWANDVSYDKIFVEQLKNSLTKSEILIGFSGSGNSKNIINAYEYAKQTGATCIGFTGNDGGKMKECCDICLQIPSDDMLTIESQHLVVCHCIINLIRSLGNPMFEYK